MDHSFLAYRLTDQQPDCWLPTDESWRTACSSWIVAHDLYHHRPADTGSLAEELASLGAEYYICHEGSGISEIESGGVLPPPGHNALTRNAAGIIGLAIESGNVGFDELALKPSGAALTDCTRAESVFRAAAESAIAEMHYLCPDINSPEWYAVKTAFSQPEVVASWIRLGYSTTKSRFPDQQRVRRAFETTCEAVRNMSSSSPLGSVLMASRAGYDTRLALFASKDPTRSRSYHEQIP